MWFDWVNACTMTLLFKCNINLLISLRIETRIEFNKRRSNYLCFQHCLRGCSNKVFQDLCHLALDIHLLCCLNLYEQAMNFSCIKIFDNTKTSQTKLYIIGWKFPLVGKCREENKNMETERIWLLCALEIEFNLLTKLFCWREANDQLNNLLWG